MNQAWIIWDWGSFNFPFREESATYYCLYTCLGFLEILQPIILFYCNAVQLSVWMRHCMCLGSLGQSNKWSGQNICNTSAQVATTTMTTATMTAFQHSACVSVRCWLLVVSATDYNRVDRFHLQFELPGHAVTWPCRPESELVEWRTLTPCHQHHLCPVSDRTPPRGHPLQKAAPPFPSTITFPIGAHVYAVLRPCLC